MIQDFACVTTKAAKAIAFLKPWRHDGPVGMSVPEGRRGEMIMYRPAEELVMVEFKYPKHTVRAILPAAAVKFEFS